MTLHNGLVPRVDRCFFEEGSRDRIENSREKGARLVVKDGPMILVGTALKKAIVVRTDRYVSHQRIDTFL